MSQIGNQNSNRPVNQLTLEGEFIKEFKNLKTASIETGTNWGSISSCCRGKLKSANGFKWQYCNKYFKIKTSPLDRLLNIEDDPDEEDI